MNFTQVVHMIVMKNFLIFESLVWFPILSELSLDMITFGLSLFDFITLVWEIHNRYYHVLYSSVKELHPFSYFFSTCSWTLKQLHLELKNMNRCFLAIVLCLLPWWHTGMALAEGGGGDTPPRFWQIRKQCQSTVLLLATPYFQTFRHPWLNE